MDEQLTQSGETQTGTTPSGPDTGSPAAAPTATAPTEQAGAPESQAASPQQGQMVPSYRLREVTERYRQLEQYALQLQERLQQSAQAPQQPAPQEDRETALIREQFRKVFPNLAQLDELNPQQLRGLLDVAPQQQQQWEQYWSNVGQNTLRSLGAKISEAYGEKTDPVTRGIFESAFISWVERDPEARDRYLSQDPSLVDDFWKKATAAVLDPVRKNAAAQVAQRVERVQRLPGVPRSTTAVGAPRPPKPKTEDDLHDAAWNAMLNSR